MLRQTALLATLLLCACDPYSSPAPHIVSIEPEEVVSGETSTIAIKLDAPLPARVDYGKRTATLLMPTLLIGGQEVSITSVEQDGTLLANLPMNLSAGQQDIRLELEDGSASVSEHNLTVLPAPPELVYRDEASGGDGETSELTGISIDHIADQNRGDPFTMVLRVRGPKALHFTGQVQISTNKGHVSPNLSDPFKHGILRQELVIDKPGANVVLTVRVGKHLIARSNPFKVWNK